MTNDDDGDDDDDGGDGGGGASREEGEDLARLERAYLVAELLLEHLAHVLPEVPRLQEDVLVQIEVEKHAGSRAPSRADPPCARDASSRDASPRPAARATVGPRVLWSHARARETSERESGRGRGRAIGAPRCEADEAVARRSRA